MNGSEIKKKHKKNADNFPIPAIVGGSEKHFGLF